MDTRRGFRLSSRYGVVTEADQYYFEVSWTDGDSGYYSISAIECGEMEKVCK